MSDYIKYMYREYLEGRTRIKKVNENQPLFPSTGAGLLIQKNKLTDDWTALNVSDGLIRIDDVNNYLTKLIVETNGLRREGNFYIEENPEDGLGAITHIALCLSKQNWFRNYVKVLKCYRWNADTQDFDIEDAIQDMMLRVL